MTKTKEFKPQFKDGDKVEMHTCFESTLEKRCYEKDIQSRRQSV